MDEQGAFDDLGSVEPGPHSLVVGADVLRHLRRQIIIATLNAGLEDRVDPRLARQVVDIVQRRFEPVVFVAVESANRLDDRFDLPFAQSRPGDAQIAVAEPLEELPK